MEQIHRICYRPNNDLLKPATNESKFNQRTDISSVDE